MHPTEGEGEVLPILCLKDDFGEDGSAEEEIEKEGEGSGDDGNGEVDKEEERESSDEESRGGVSLFTGQSPLQGGMQAKVAKRSRKKKNRTQKKNSANAQMDLQRQEVSTYVQGVPIVWHFMWSTCVCCILVVNDIVECYL